MGGTFAAGGSFASTGNGQDDVPNGTLFSGTFSTPVTWTMVARANGTHNYTLTGTLSGTLGCGKISSGDTSVVVPEPGSLGLLGTGLISWLDCLVAS